MRRGVTFWPCYARKIVCVSGGLQALLRLPPSFTNLLPSPLVQVLCIFLGLFVCTSICQLSSWAKSSLNVYFRNLLSFCHICQGPAGCGLGRGQEQHPNLPTCATFRLCLGGGGCLPQLPWHWRHSPGFFIFLQKNAWGKHLLLQKFGMTVSFAAGLFFQPSPDKEVNKCLLFFLFPYGLFTGFCLCVYECSLALTAVRELFY